MVRILQYGLSPRIGGIETYLLKLTQNIDRNNYRFDFLIEDGNEPCFYNELKSMNCNFYKITPRRKSIIKNKRDLNELFTKEKFDIFHCNLNALSYIEPVHIALKKGVKTIVHSRNAGSINPLYSMILHYYNYILLPKSKVKMLAVSDLAGKWMFGNSNYTILNNGIDVNKFKFNEQARIDIRKKFELDESFVVGHIGSLTQQKNHDFLLKVFGEIVKANKKAKLILVGEGRLESEIKNKISELHLDDYVFLMGKRNDISELLSAMDFFLFPSFYEGFPNALIEAQTSGLPCLISDNITREVKINSNIISLSLNESPSKWAETIIINSTKINRKNAYQKIIDFGFSVIQEIEKIQNIYNEMLEVR